jgi:hypothetical protein
VGDERGETSEKIALALLGIAGFELIKMFRHPSCPHPIPPPQAGEGTVWR